jgi:hypothetical protein
VAGQGVLPASGTRVWLRDATGEDEILVLASAEPPVSTILSLAARLASDGTGQPLDWLALPAVDLGAGALLIRATWLGETIRTEALCPSEKCGEPIDIAFGIPDYLEHHRPRRVLMLSRDDDGWLSFDGGDTRFRIPTIADMLAELHDRGQTLRVRCLRPPNPTAKYLRRVDRALEALAPRLDGELSGTCPACGTVVELRFEPIGYVLEELRDACVGVYAQVHELALAYHWSEESILALDRRTRGRYVAMVRGEMVLA